MALPTLPEALVVEALSPLVFAIGEGADVDEAFDSASGREETDPSFLRVADPSRIEVVDDKLSADAAVSAALAWRVERTEAAAAGAVADYDTPEAGPREVGPDPDPAGDVVAAFGIVARASHKRTRFKVVVEDVDLDVDTGARGRWTAAPAAMAAALTSALASLEVPPAAASALETSTYTRRARYKAIAEPVKAKSEAQFVVLSGDLIVSRGHRTASEARRAAVALLKERGNDNHDLSGLEVYKLAGREGGRPWISVRRTRVFQKIVATLIHTEAKSDKEPKTVAWLFVTAPS